MSVLFPMSERTQGHSIPGWANSLAAHVYPAEAEFAAWDEDPARRWQIPPLLEELKAKARAAGLWNLFLPTGEHRLGNLEYARLGRTHGPLR